MSTETFALAPDRSQALASLVAGTDDYYHYNILHLQNNKDDKANKAKAKAKVKELLEQAPAGEWSDAEIADRPFRHVAVFPPLLLIASSDSDCDCETSCVLSNNGVENFLHDAPSSAALSHK